MYVGDAQDAQDDVVRASASGRNFFFCDDYRKKDLFSFVLIIFGWLVVEHYIH